MAKGVSSSASFSKKIDDARIAQLVEQRFCKPQAVGSSPTSGTSLECNIDRSQISRSYG